VELLRSIQREISKAGYDLILYSVDELDKKNMFLKKTIREKKVDGVMLLSLEISDEEAERFLKSNFPIVLVDTYHPKLDSISIENEYGAFEATNHLIDLGYERIAMITGQISSVPSSLRLEGYKKALEDHNISFNEKYVYSVSANNNEDISLNHGFNEESGYKGMQHFLGQSNDRPAAVFIASDIQAIGAIRAITEKGLCIPDDIAIVSFDDIQLARYFGLTTVHQPIEKMGSLAVKRLLEYLQSKNGALYSVKLKTNLIIRQSCGAKLKNKQ
jgi:DNA-binding LacI/PurR family transcriptional regulator